MCKACSETPDGAGRRCNRTDGFTSVESEQRNRVRNLRNSADALAAGEPQAAANALAHAIAAQRRIDGGPSAPLVEPAETEAPHRDVVISPSEVERFRGDLDNLNRSRQERDRTPFGIEVTRQRRVVDGDPTLAWEQATVRLTGPREDLDRLRFSGATRTVAEKRANTDDVLAVACSAVRQSGGQYISRAENGENSTPAKVDSYVADEPRGAVRAALTPTAEDRAQAAEVRKWARIQEPNSDYMRAMRHALSDDYVSLREVGTAASAVSGYLRFSARGSASEASGVTPLHRSRWLSSPGDKIVLVGHVEKVVPMYHESRIDPHFLYVFRTPDGDLVKWKTSATKGLEEGDTVTLRGTVKSHGEFAGERETELSYCTPKIHRRSA